MNHRKNNYSLLEEMGEVFFLEDINMPHEFSKKYKEQKEKLLSTQKRPSSQVLLKVAAILIGIFCLVPVTVLGAKLMKHYFIKHQDTGKYQDEYTFEKNSEADSLPNVLHVKVMTDFPDEFVREEGEGKLIWNTSDGRSLSLLLLGAREINKITLQNVKQQTQLTLNGYDAVYSIVNTVTPSVTGNSYSKNMLIFFEDKGYVLEIWGNDAISEEEFFTLSGQVSLMETTYDQADIPGATYKTETSTTSDLGSTSVNPDSNLAPITVQMNETFEAVFPDYNASVTGFSATKVSMKVTDAKVINTATELKDGVFVGIGVDNPLICPDGTLSDYSRSLVKSGDGINSLDEVIETKSFHQKLLS